MALEDLKKQIKEHQTKVLHRIKEWELTLEEKTALTKSITENDLDSFQAILLDKVFPLDLLEELKQIMGHASELPVTDYREFLIYYTGLDSTTTTQEALREKINPVLHEMIGL